MTTPVSKPLEELIAQIMLADAQATLPPWSKPHLVDAIASIANRDDCAEDELVPCWPETDAALIALLRNSFPDLIRGIDALREERDDARADFADLLKDMGQKLAGANERAEKHFLEVERLTSVNQRLGKVAEAARQLYVRPSTEHLYVVTKSTAEDLFAALDALEKP